jgi:mitosis inhibitor protein kinase SWE1
MAVDSMADTDASVDDMPPTPTKGHGASSRRSKESSLRRKTFRSRPMIGNDTFAAPEVVNDFNCKSICQILTAASHDKIHVDSADCSLPPVQASIARIRLLRRTKTFGRPSPLSQQILRTTLLSYNPSFFPIKRPLLTTLQRQSSRSALRHLALLD